MTKYEKRAWKIGTFSCYRASMDDWCAAIAVPTSSLNRAFFQGYAPTRAAAIRAVLAVADEAAKRIEASR